MFLGLGAPSPSIEETYRPLFALDFWKRSGRFYEISPKNQREFLSQLCEISYRPVPVRFPASIDLPPDSSSLFLLSMDCRFTLWVVLTMKLPTDRKSFSLSRLSSTSLSQEDKDEVFERQGSYCPGSEIHDEEDLDFCSLPWAYLGRQDTGQRSNFFLIPCHVRCPVI